MLAMESIQGSQQERELASRLAELKAQQLQAQAQMQRAVNQPAPGGAGPSGGMPGWVIPAAIGVAGLVLVLVLMKSKKSA